MNIYAATATALVLALGLTQSARAGQMIVKARSDGTVSLDGFHPRSEATLGAASDVFGDPDSSRGHFNATECRVRWASLSLTIEFANFGGQDACDPDYGYANFAVIKGPHSRQWVTSAGLRTGDSVERLRHRYPHASRHGSSWWLVTGISNVGCNACRYAILRATTSSGRVEALRLAIGAAGD
jgi:hypothetical protein